MNWTARKTTRPEINNFYILDDFASLRLSHLTLHRRQKRNIILVSHRFAFTVFETTCTVWDETLPFFTLGDELKRLHENLVLSNDSERMCEGLTFETLAFQIFHGGNSTLINSLEKTKISRFTLRPTQHHSFFRNNKFYKAITIFLQLT